MIIRFFALMLVFVGLTGAMAQVQTQQPATPHAHKTTIGTLQVAYWQPAAMAAKQPVLLFSHGFDSCNTQSGFLMQALADDGYWVFAPNHDDVGCAIGTKGTMGPVMPFEQPQSWSDKTYADRGDDIRMLWDALHHDARFKDKIDFDRLGLIGHSLGGYTILGLVGAWPSWTTIPNVKAVLALAPYTEPYILHKTLSRIKVPVMFQGGTRDDNTTPPIKKSGGAYDQTPKPKYYVEFYGATHIAWTDANPTYAPYITAYSIAFLDHYVKGAAASPDLTSVGDGVSALRYDSELGAKK